MLSLLFLIFTVLNIYCIDAGYIYHNLWPWTNSAPYNPNNLTTPYCTWDTLGDATVMTSTTLTNRCAKDPFLTTYSIAYCNEELTYMYNLECINSNCTNCTVYPTELNTCTFANSGGKGLNYSTILATCRLLAGDIPWPSNNSNSATPTAQEPAQLIPEEGKKNNVTSPVQGVQTVPQQVEHLSKSSGCALYNSSAMACYFVFFMLKYLYMSF